MASLPLTSFLLACVLCGQASGKSSCSDLGSSDEACGDEASVMQLRQQHSSRQSVVCPGSQNGPGVPFLAASFQHQTNCAGNQCCPGTVATDNKTFPCPTADPDFECEAAAPEQVVYTLVVGTCELKLPDSAPVVTRCYNGMIPGPTLYMKPGMIVTVHLHNTLEMPNPPPYLVDVANDYQNMTDPVEKNQSDFGEKEEASKGLLDDYTSNSTGSLFGHVNSTNIHVHGIVVPGHEPADDILIEVLPGTNYTYTYNIPTYHMPGTHWYHPHRHHAAGIQVNGGMFGAIIVQDTPGVIPHEYANAEEHILGINTLNVTLQKEVANMSEDKLWQTNSTATITLVNGKDKPSLSIKAGKWYRLRMLFAAEFRALRAVLDEFEGQCQLKLLAKDGIYLNVVPRTVTAMFMATGNTVDVMISCSCNTSTSCSTMMRSTWGAAANNETFTQSVLFGRTYVGEILQLEISGDNSCSPPSLPRFETKKPCYLVDLRNATVLPGNTHSVAMFWGPIKLPDFAEGAIKDFREMYDTPLGVEVAGLYGVIWDKGRFNRMLHDDQAAIATLPMETVQEWEVGGVTYHPLHVHVQPFQLQTFEFGHRIESEGEEAWYQPGDWHDTFFGTVGVPKIRFALRLRGINKYVLHCHFLNHEDQGLMTFFNVTDSECVIPDQCAPAIAAASGKTCFTNYNTLALGYTLLD